MVLVSGVLNYQYDYNLPLRVDNPVLISGVFIEQPQFVHLSEYRRLLNYGTNSPYVKYDYVDAAPSGYEPKGDASTLSIFTPGNVLYIDYILDLRNTLDLLFEAYSLDSPWSAYDHKLDWLTNTYPLSPSGYVGKHLHRAPSSVGYILDSSLEILGGSGAIYDIDYGEIAFNPYPFFAKTKSLDVHGTSILDKFMMNVSPLYPCVQNTNGQVPHPGVDYVPQVAGSGYVNPTHTASGLVRIDGYSISSGTLISATNLINKSIRENAFTFVTSEKRYVVPSGFNCDFSRNFYMPPSGIASGVYRLCLQNQSQFFPNTVIQSGLISLWPNYSSQFSGIITNDVQSGHARDLHDGYEVFDDCLWMLDHGYFPGTNGFATEASGLCIVSPFTGRFLWIKHADRKSHSVGGTFGIARWDLNLRGLIKASGVDGLSKLYRMNPQFLSTGAGSSDYPFRAKFQEYKYNNLDYGQEIFEDVSNSTPTFDATPPILTQSIAHDTTADAIYVYGDSSVSVAHRLDKFITTGSKRFSISDSWRFNVVLVGIINTPIHPDRICYISSSDKLAGWRVNGLFPATSVGGTAGYPASGIGDITLNSPSAGIVSYANSIDYSTEKPIRDIPPHPIYGHYTRMLILDVKDVNSGVHVPNGVWVIVAVSAAINDPTSGTNKNVYLYLLQIKERASIWEVVKSFSLGELGINPSASSLANIHFVHGDLV